MNKKVIGLMGGAISALALLGPARAASAAAPASAQTLAASSFEDLLQPLPNPVAVLSAMDEGRATRSKLVGGELTLVYHHHHHHHHNQYYYHHHHHHHHQYFPFFPHHHHHHHHHQFFWWH